MDAPGTERPPVTPAQQAPEYIRLARDGAANYAGPLIAAAIGLAVVPLLLDRLGAERYGVLLVAMTCATLATFFDLGLGSVVTKEAAGESSDRDRFMHGAGTLVLVIGIIGALLLALAGLGAHLLGFAPTTPETALVFAFIGAAYCGDQLTLYHTAVLGGIRRFDIVNGLLVAAMVARAAGSVGLLVAGAGVVTIAAWYAASAWIWALVNVVTVRRVSPRNALRLARPERAVLLPRLGFGAGSLAIMVSLGVLWNIPTLLVAAISGSGASAVFQVSQRFPLALQALPERVSATLFPAAGEPAAADRDSALWLIANGTRLINVVLTPFLAILLAAPADLLEAWLGEVPEHGVAVLRLTVLTVLANALGASALQVIWGRGAVRAAGRAVAVGAGLGVIAAAALTPWLGGPGAAGGLLLGAAVVSGSVLLAASELTERPLSALVGPAARAAAIPGVACTLVALALARLELTTGWREVALVGAVTILAYLSILVTLRNAGPEAEVVRAALRRSRALRSGVYLALGLRDAVRDTRRRRRTQAHEPYEAAVDPWGYDSGWGARHLELTNRLLDLAAREAPIGTAIDVGCGEGFVTVALARRAGQVLGVDTSPVALERARMRCDAEGNVQLRRWDVLDGEALGDFDVVLAMGVLEVFRRPATVRRARRTIVGMVAPGGHLLVTTTKQSPVVEEAFWSRSLLRGSRALDGALLKDGSLERRASEETDTHLLTLYRKRS